MFGKRQQDRDVLGDGRRTGPDDGDAAGEPTGTILRRLAANLRDMAAAHGLAAAQDLRRVIRDVVVSMILLSTVMMLGLYLIGLLVVAAVLALSLVLPAWAAALVVFAGVTVFAGALLLATAVTLRRIVRRMRATIAAAKEDARWFRTRILRID
ncbi:MAG TPA: phage holin family protein [bacterium]|nr:phage holin family protein [bacterium]